MANVEQYLDLITSEHRDKPNYIAFMTALLQPFVDIQNVTASLPRLFDLDYAVGVQLDDVGKWIGITRYLRVPLTGVYFSFDTSGLGFDEGTWIGPFDPESGLVALPDDAYRTLLRAKIANNTWNGSIETAYEFMAPVFPGNTFFIQDNGDMSMFVGVVGPVPLDAVTYALFTGGYLDVKPSGVRIAGYVTASELGAPIFAFDSDGTAMAGFDTGAWATIVEGS